MEPPVQARCLKLCREVKYDPTDPEAPYTLQGVVAYLGPKDDYGYPVCLESVWLYAELFGEDGRYTMWVAMAQIDEDGTELDPPYMVRRPTPVRVRPARFVEPVRLYLARLPFPTAGLYELRLMLDGFDEPVGTDRVFLMEV